MLVLSRKVGERVQLGDNITVTLVKIQGNVVRLGIDAPAGMTVSREELLKRVASKCNGDAAEQQPARI
jgi:carbon storage regulator